MNLVCIAPNGILEVWVEVGGDWYVTNYLRTLNMMGPSPEFWGRIVLGEL